MTHRLTKNPWAADPFLKETFAFFVDSGESLVKTIANSPDIRSIFDHRVTVFVNQSSVALRRVRDLQAAKQRFASTQKPLARLVLYLPAMIATAYEVQTRRSTDIGRRATGFLQNLSEEKLLALAMLADAGDVAMRVIRFFDEPRYDVAAVPEMLLAFCNEISDMFLSRAVLKPTIVTVDGREQVVCHTYTSYMLAMLQAEPLLVTTQEGRSTVTRSIGGPDSIQPAVLARCCARMAGWVKLATSSLQAEFPDWEAISAFGAFDLSLSLDDETARSFVTRSLSRLAATFGVDKQPLLHQFNDFRRAAKGHREKGLDNFNAWAQSVASVRASGAKTVASHERHALEQILTRYGTFLGASTSSVERNFSALTAAVGPQRSTLSTVSTASDLRLKVLDLTQDQQSNLVRQAQLIWLQHFGLCKTSGEHRQSRWKSSSCKKALHAKMTFEDKQKLASSLKVPLRRRTMASIAQDAAAQAAGAWTASHDKAS